ncbi:Phosphoheptose isomerase [Chromobacterium violaceum]|uniref:Phosphoheptose isomerase n=1 Tax=Chromobacterium violaceum TaxID=536 RepID=A0A447T6K1_CHRVL|nr:Phosphoheptose isomerase [Chromobacterium violaceum]
MDLIDRVNGHFLESIAAKQEAMELLSPGVAAAAERMVACLMNEGKILACGNGGSAADAQHFAAEMVGRFEKERPAWRRFRWPPTLRADRHRQRLRFRHGVLQAGAGAGPYQRPAAGDLHLGNSANVIEAVYAAHERA